MEDNTVPRWRRAAFIFLLIVALALFLGRGVGRATMHGKDLAPVYCSSRAWMAGEEPYVLAQARQRTWEGCAEEGILPGGSTLTMYPPTTFVLYAPVSLLPWPVARVVVAVLGAAMAGVMLVSLLSLTSGRLPHPDFRILLTAAVFGFAPLHTALGQGQPAIPAVALLLAAGALAAKSADAGKGERSRDILAGALLGLALCLKPPLALPFLLYFGFLRRWLLCAAALGLVAVIGGIALLGLANAGDWLASYRQNIAEVSATAGRLTRDNPDLAQHIQAEVAFASLFGAARPARLLGMAMTAALLAALAVAVFKQRAYVALAENRLLPLASVSALAMFGISYHRFYDGLLVLLPLAWALTVLYEPAQRKQAIAVLALSALFFAPGGKLLSMAAPHLPAALRDSVLWYGILLPHHAWAVLLLNLILFAAYLAFVFQPASVREPESV
jgi:hypothetical protein